MLIRWIIYWSQENLFGVLGYVDSNSEDSDSDMSEVDSIDSDLENERQKTYKRAVYKDDMKVLKKHIKTDLKPGSKRSGAPTDSLKLKFVFGWVMI